MTRTREHTILKLTEVRCVFCKKLLLKVASGATLEVRCPKCKHLNKFRAPESA